MGEPKEYVLDKEESMTVMHMVQDCIDRGMIAKGYRIGTINTILFENTDMFEHFDCEFEVVIRTKR